MADHRARDFDIRSAVRQLRRLASQSDRVDAGARLFYALGGRGADRARLERVVAHPLGGALLSARPRVGDLLSDADYLRSLPPGSLGREYLQWAEAEGLSIAALEAAVAPSYPSSGNEDSDYLRARGRDLHDLLHVVTGYDRDVLGEVALLTFTAIQGGSRALDLLSLLGCGLALARGRIDVRRLRSEARARARQAPFLSRPGLGGATTSTSRGSQAEVAACSHAALSAAATQASQAGIGVSATGSRLRHRIRMGERERPGCGAACCEVLQALTGLAGRWAMAH